MAKEELEEYEEELEEEEEEELDATEMLEQELRAIYAEMKKWPKTSQEYMVLAQRSTDLTEQKRNLQEADRNSVQSDEIKRQRFVPYFQIAGNILGNAVGSAVGQYFNRRTVNDVLDCERDGFIPNSKATTFIQKPRI